MSYYGSYYGGLGYGFGGLGCGFGGLGYGFGGLGYGCGCGCGFSPNFGRFRYCCYRPCCFGRYWGWGFY